MYYTSYDKSELEAYNNLISKGEKYDGVFTTQWSNIIEHPTNGLFAILKNDKYKVTGLNEINKLSSDWFPEDVE